MHSSTYEADLRDIFFVLFEHLPFREVLGQGQYEHVGEDDVRTILEAAADFAREVVAPTSAPSDRVGVTWDNGKVTVPAALEPLWQSVREMGWISLVAPMSVEGQQMPKLVGTVVDEMFIAAHPAFHTYLGLCRAAANLLLHHADQTLIETYVPRLISGEWQGTMCLTEAGAGSDVGASTTRAVPLGDGTYSIKGSKVFITSGDHQLTQNHVHLVLARLPDAAGGVKGLSLFLVPKYRVNPDGSPGTYNDVLCSKVEEKLGIHASATCVMNFGDNDACIGYLVGKPHQGIRCMFHMMNEERIIVGLQGQALAASMYRNALGYARERVQGSDIGQGKSVTEDKVAIVEHPDVRRMLMTVKALAEGGRALLYRTSLELDRSETAADEDARNRHADLVSLLTPLCKAWGSDSGVEACNLALQVYGGYGYTADYPAEQHLRDARIAPIYEGTNGIQAIDLLFRKVLGTNGKLAMRMGAEIQSWISQHADHPSLKKEAAQLGQSLEELNAVTRALGKQAATDMRLAALGATPFLTLFGNVVVAFLLLEQATIAATKLEAYPVPTDREARRHWLADNAQAGFYAAKIETAKFFVHQVLTQNRWKAAQILSQDASANDVVFG